MDTMKLLKSAVSAATSAGRNVGSADVALSFAVASLAWTAIAVAVWLVTGQMVILDEDEDGS